jgi:dUTP pyrophosphatase
MTTDLIVRYRGESAPVYQTSGAAGCDLISSCDQIIDPHDWGIIPTGLFIEIPDGYEAQIRSRSGLAAKNGVFVLNSPGTIDNDYRGEIKVILANTSHHPFIIKKGDRIAQMVFSPVTQATFESATELSKTDRGTGGFGSTGI